MTKDRIREILERIFWDSVSPGVQMPKVLRDNISKSTSELQALITEAENKKLDEALAEIGKMDGEGKWISEDKIDKHDLVKRISRLKEKGEVNGNK